MMQIKNLTITHKKDMRTLVENFSFVLNPGDRAVMIGEEGNGKSTLLKLICDPALVESYAEFTGEIIKNRQKTGYLPQELEEQNREKSVWEYFTRNTGFYNMTPKELSNISRALGIPADIYYSQQKMGALSGGEKIKLQMAGILMENPDILLLDEPSNDIDIRTLEWMEDFMNQCQIPILYISHDETLIERTANVIIHLEQINRKTKPRYSVAKMDYRTYMENRARGLTNQERIARKEREDARKQEERFRRIQQKVERDQNNITRQNPHGGQLLKKKMHAVKAMERRYLREAEDRTEIPETEDAIFIRFPKDTSIPNGKTVLAYSLDKLCIGERVLSQQIALSVKGPKKVCITGANGIGKTTLLRKIAESMQERTDLHVAYMPQNYEEKMDGSKTPAEFLQKKGDKEEISRIRTYLGSMKYTADEMDHSISQLSGGQKAKLFFLKMSLDGSNVLLLDEPTRNFSPLSGPVIRRLLADFKGVVISVSHDRKYMDEVCDTIYELTENGLEKRKG